MLTLEQLNALRGLNSSMPQSDKKTDTGVAIQSVATTDNSENNTNIPKTSDHANTEVTAETKQSESFYSNPIEAPCKNYMDEQGYFAYIDAYTHEVSHINLESGKIYTQDEVYQMSLSHAVRALPETYHNLTWQQVIDNDTSYDRFGSPVFTYEEINRALTKSKEPTSPTTGEIQKQPNDEAKTDPWGFPKE